MSIQLGQVYESVAGDRQIKVVRVHSTTPGVWGFGKVYVVTLTPDGREIRRRPLEASQLHASRLTAKGEPRRNGYVLVEE